MTLNRNHGWAVVHISEYKQNSKISIYIQVYRKYLLGNCKSISV